MTRKKCKPQTLPHSSDQLPKCAFPIFMDPQKLYRENVNDIAKSLVVIMIICGIHECKANGTIDIIKNIFGHYDEMRHRPNCTKPPKKMCKNNVIVCLSKKCLMTLVETQLTYYIIKYALKAYFNSIPQIGVKNAIMDSQLICGQETAWIRAAKRTVQVYEECKDILRPIVKNYYSEIKSVYKCLFQRIRQRTEPLEIPGCKMCCKSSEKLVTQSSSSQQSLTKIYTETIKEMPQLEKEYPFHSFTKCCKCKFPLDLCSCKINPITGKLCIDCSQGPYICEWYRMDKEYRVKAKYHVCPIDCEKHSSLLSEDECQCDLLQDNDCQVDDDNESEDSEYENDFIEIKNDICVEESESDTEECEPKMDGCTYCCHLPVCDKTIYTETQKSPPYIKRDSDDPVFVEFQVIPPSKNIKNVRLPPEIPHRRKRPPIKGERRWIEKQTTDKDKNATSKDEQNDKNLEAKSKTNKSQDGKQKNKDFGSTDNAIAGNEIAKDYNNAGTSSTGAPNQLGRTKGDENRGNRYENDGTKGSGNKDYGRGNGTKGDRTKSDGYTADGKNVDGVERVYDNRTRGDRKSMLLSFVRGGQGEQRNIDGQRNKGEQRNNGWQRNNGGLRNISGQRNNGGQRTNGGQRKNDEANKKYGSGRRKLPCCKCGTKENIKPIKCLHCKPILIPKNRIVPAPIVC